MWSLVAACSPAVPTGGAPAPLPGPAPVEQPAPAPAAEPAAPPPLQVEVGPLDSEARDTTCPCAVTRAGDATVAILAGSGEEVAWFHLDGEDRALRRTSPVPPRFGPVGMRTTETYALPPYVVSVEWTVTDRPCEDCDTIHVRARAEVQRADGATATFEGRGACSC